VQGVSFKGRGKHLSSWEEGHRFYNLISEEVNRRCPRLPGKKDTQMFWKTHRRNHRGRRGGGHPICRVLSFKMREKKKKIRGKIHLYLPLYQMIDPKDRDGIVKEVRIKLPIKHE